MVLRKIVSGGQTGVDRAALDVAISFEIEHGGWCPKGRLAEDGKISSEYCLRETSSKDYAVRTEKNVIDSDATLIIYRNRLSGGTRLTWQLAKKHRRDLFLIDLDEQPNVAELATWIAKHNIGVLNVAGPRESGCPGIFLDAQLFLSDLIRELRTDSLK